MGVADRTSRIIFAIILIVIGYFFKKDLGIWQYLLYFISGILFLNAIFGYCFFYRLFKISTVLEHNKEIKKSITKKK